MPRLAANLSMMFTEHAFLDRFGAAAKTDSVVAPDGAVCGAIVLFIGDYDATKVCVNAEAAASTIERNVETNLKRSLAPSLQPVIAGTLIVQIIMSPDGPVEVAETNAMSNPAASSVPAALPQSLNNTPNPIAAQATEIEKPKGPVTSMVFAQSAYDFGIPPFGSSYNTHNIFIYNE